MLLLSGQIQPTLAEAVDGKKVLLLPKTHPSMARMYSRSHCILKHHGHICKSCNTFRDNEMTQPNQSSLKSCLWDGRNTPFKCKLCIQNKHGIWETTLWTIAQCNCQSWVLISFSLFFHECKFSRTVTFISFWSLDPAKHLHTYLNLDCRFREPKIRKGPSVGALL